MDPRQPGKNQAGLPPVDSETGLPQCTRKRRPVGPLHQGRLLTAARCAHGALDLSEIILVIRTSFGPQVGRGLGAWAKGNEEEKLGDWREEECIAGKSSTFSDSADFIQRTRTKG